MNLFDMLAGAQGGNGFDALAKQFGLSQQQTQSAVEALMPAFSNAFRQNAADPTGLGSLLTALASGQHAKYAQNAASAFSPQGMAEGNGILGHLFGSKELSRAVAAQASQATGIGQDTLKQMLPAIASMLMGALFKQTSNQMQAGTFGASNPLGQIIEQMMKQGGGAGRPAPQQSDNPLGDILGQILGGGQGGQSGGGNPMGDILGQILKGGGQGQPQSRQGQGDNPLGDILGQILGGGRQQAEPEEDAPQRRQQRQQPQSDNPLGDILGQILGGGRPQAEPEDEPQPQRRQQRQQPQAQPNNPLEDIFGKMFNPGGQGGVAQDQSYQQGMDNIFEQFRRGVDRYR